MHGDCLDMMKNIKDNTIDLTVTSPPYDNLRTYNDSLEWNEDIWQGVLKELYRVTCEGGVVVWVVGDATINGSETGTSFKQALYAKEIGFKLHDTMIYYKNTPPLTHRRYEQHFEYMFVFVKGKLKTFNGIREDKLYMDNRKSKMIRREANGEYDMGKPSNNKTKLKGNVWKIFAGGGANDSIASLHPAIFPLKLAHDHIISWSNEGDTVLDPFMGSGTTGAVCLDTNRKFIGIEKVDKYFELSKTRLEEHEKKLLEKIEIDSLST